MKIVAYNFAAFPFFFVEAVKLSKNIEWFAIIPSYHYKEMVERSIGKNKVLYLQEHLNSEMDKAVDMEELKTYPGSIYRDIAADKAVMKKLNKDYQLRNAFHTYRIYKKFIKSIKPDAVFFPVIESHDAMILYKICLELGIQAIVYTYNRNFGGSFFSPDCFESLPAYVKNVQVDKAHLQKAKKFISDFRKTFKSPARIATPPKEEDKISWSKPSFFSRSIRYLECVIRNEEPHHITESTLPQKIKVNVLPLTKKVRVAKGNFSRKYCDIFSIDQLPKKFIYYPLHLTPESSINTPAPFFVDQLRAIDLILFSMPSDHLLVVKEHPAVLGMRSFSFYDELKKRPGVVFADAFVPSIEIIKKASLTISVTGTACLEAFLLGLPSMHLGRSFFSDQISAGSQLELAKDILSAMENRPSEDKISDFVAKVFMASKEFILFDPTDPYMDANLAVNKNNISAFLDALEWHLSKMEESVK